MQKSENNNPKSRPMGAAHKEPLHNPPKSKIQDIGGRPHKIDTFSSLVSIVTIANAVLDTTSLHLPRHEANALEVGVGPHQHPQCGQQPRDHLPHQARQIVAGAPGGFPKMKG